MRAGLRRDLTVALKARDHVAVAALRSALAAIDNAEAPAVDDAGPRTAESQHVAGSVVDPSAAEVEPHHLTEADQRAIVEAEIHERAEAAREFEQVGRHDRAQRLRSEADVLSRHLRPAP